MARRRSAMMRLPWFEYRAPETLAEAAQILAGEGANAALIAGGTDLLPNMKRRQMAPRVLVSVRQIPELRRNGSVLGAGVTLTEIVHKPALPLGLRQAAAQVATVHLRNMGTIGGNLCLDTRCNYYDQNYEWRKAIDFCMKKDGATCWVATSSPKCLAVSSTDTAPALIALDASVTLLSAAGSRSIPVEALYQNDGIHYLTRRADEIVTAIDVPRRDGWRSTYWKLRRRGSFDFPVLSVAAAVKTTRDGVVEDARIVLGAVASQPVVAADAAALLRDGLLTDERIADTAQRAAQPARPMDNTDFTLHWRKRMTAAFVTYAL